MIDLIRWVATVAVGALCILVGSCGGGGTGSPVSPPSPGPAPTGWVLWRAESFDGDRALADGESFGEDGWLTVTLRGDGRLTLDGGRAHVETPNFPDSALIRLTESLPENYKLRVRLGGVDYDLANYEPEDSLDPDFKYGGNWKENGFYWLALTDRLVEPTSGEAWWHRYRKIVIDSDDHTNTPLPVYMVYMNPDLDREQGDWTSGDAELLRTWSLGAWNLSTWNWDVAFNYDPLAFYEVEIEKLQGTLVFRAYDGDGTLIEETTPVNLDDIYAMGKQASEFEFAYIGEPHVDSYEGEAAVDAITLWRWVAPE